MKAEIISIGDEILIGQVINTNASWLGVKLNEIGIEVYQISSVSDSKIHILNALKEASGRAGLILITGGLGPTRDDITKQSLCEYFETELVFDEESFQNIKKLFDLRRLGPAISDLNRKQAELPLGCLPLKNCNGTAPGMWFEKNGVIYVFMPGVPFEMQSVFEEQVIPRLQSKNDTLCILHKTVLTQGVGESWLAEKISNWEDNLPAHAKLAYLPQPGIVRLRLSLKGNNRDALEKTAENEIAKLQKIIPGLIFGFDNDTLEEVAGKLLKERNQTLSTAESCTGGYIAHLITSIAGSSSYYTGSVIAYSNTIKEKVLGVTRESLTAHGAVSEAVVTEMASGVKNLLNTDYAIATSGIAGPDGGTKEKPVGTIWIAIATPECVYSENFHFGEHRGRNIRRTALQALNMLRKAILGEIP